MRAALLALLLVVSATTFTLPAQAYQTHAAGSWSTSSALPAVNASARSTLTSGAVVTASVSGANLRLTTLNSPPGDRGAVPGNFRPQIPADTALIGLTAAAAGCAAFVDCFNRGTLTFSFNRPVHDPVLHIAGSGATIGNTGSTHVAHTLTTPGVTLDGPLAGATNMTIGQNGTRVEAPNRNLNVLCNSSGARSAPASCGSVRMNGTVSSVSFQVDMLTNSSNATDDFYVAGVSVDEDFGDAPASYDIGAAASHVVGDLALGSGVSVDNPTTINLGSTTPSPKAVAAGADNNLPAGDDLDDGVAAFPRLARSNAGDDYSVPVTLSGASQAGRVCAWIDFNGNGSFDNNERACATFAAGARSATITWKIPQNVKCGNTYARFRASYNTDQAANATGLADSGEVEDYRLPVECLDIKKSTPKTTANPGDQVPYTVTITNSGATDVTGLTVSDDLTQVLDDATFNNDQAATSGSISYAAPKLTWTGDVAKGKTVTLTYSVTVKNPITGDHQLRNAVVSSAGNCPAGSTDPDCSTTVNTPGVKIEKSVDRQSADPGDTVKYTVKVTNTGKTPLNAMFADDLTKVLDDATWGSATASSGTATFASPNLTWTGALAVGASATVTYTVVVTGNGDKQLTNVVTSETPGNNCVPSCTTDTPVSGVRFEKQADKQSVNPGETVTYTVTVTNTGKTPLQGATFTDDLAKVLDDAEWVSATASSGVAEFVPPKLTWTGNLPIGGSATVTYSLKVRNPVKGDFQLDNAITSSTPGGNCPPGSADPKCGTTTPVAGLKIEKAVDRQSANPGDTVTYTVKVTNTGKTSLNATFSDDLSKVLDDAEWGSVNASAGTATFAAPKLNWSGTLAVGGSATITYTVKVTGKGDHLLDNVITSTTPGNNCPPDSTDPDCRTSTPVSGVEIKKEVDRQSANPGDTVKYTVTVRNTGKTQLNASFVDDLTQVLDDAAWGSVSASSGTPSFTAPKLTWNGPLAPGESATVTYTVVANGKGDKQLTNVVTSETPGNNCVPNCTTTTPISGVQFEKSVDRQSAKPGDTVKYAVTVRNTGKTPLQGATFTDDLTKVLDDAEWVSAEASTGSASFAAPKLTWTGNLAVDGTATVTYTVKVGDPADFKLDNVITSTTPGANCPGGEKCSTSTPIAGLRIEKSDDRDQVVPGDTVTYQIKVTNTGQTVHTGASFTDDLTKVLDDAVYNDDAQATTGAVTLVWPRLEWKGDLPIGGTATITYTVTVKNPNPGDKKLNNKVTSDTPGNNCPPGSTDPSCSTETPGRELTIEKKADKQSANPGDSVTYTLTITNTGQVPLAGEKVTDDLSGVLDDATWVSVQASTGKAEFAAPTLTWTGDLAVGASATLTYVVKVNDPIKGDHRLANVVSSEVPGNCPPGSTDPKCSTTTPLPGMEIVKEVDRRSANPGDTVTYTVTVRNTGQTELNASFRDDLTKVLDDATWGGTNAGTFTSPVLTWAGVLPVGGSAVVKYTVVVTGKGDHQLTNVVTSDTSGNNCVPSCTTDTPVSGVEIKKVAEPASTKPGDTVKYMVTVRNTGKTVLDASFADDLTGVLDDATWESVNASTGTATYAAPKLSWSGQLGVGETATVTYTVKVTGAGDKRLKNVVTSDTSGNNCVPSCTTDTPVAALKLVKKSEPATTKPGDTVKYAVTITNAGQTVHSGISVADDLTGVLDDATWNGDQAASAGSVSFAAPKLTWTGDLAVGASVTVTYSVKVTGAGDKRLKNVVSSETPGTDCSEGCTTDTPVAGLEIVKKAAPGKPVPGDVVTYTVTVRNTGQTPQNASFGDDLTGVLDDATWNGDAQASVGEVTYAAPKLSWSGALPIGSQAVITYSVKVTAAGDHRLNNVVTSDDPGGNCPPGSTDPKCSTSTPLPGMEVSKSVDVQSAKPGDAVTYTVKVVNTGQTDIAGASFVDDLSKVLDDATWVGTSAGTFTSPKLTWTGELPVGATVTVTYSVKVNNPVKGDFSLDNVVTTETPGGKCVECTTVTPVAGLKLVKTSEPESAKPGDEVKYTVTITNTGRTVHSGITVTDDLSGVLDDATWVGTSAGTFTSPKLTWTGDLAVGKSMTITYSVKVTGDGDKRLKNVVSSDVPDTDCSEGCTTDTPIAGFQIVKKADRAEAKPGEKVTYTVVVTNTGATMLRDAAFVDDMTEVLDDATYNGDAASTSGLATYAAPKLTWKGDLAVGASETVRYSVTVTSKGDLRLKNVVTSDTPGSNCRDGCAVEVLVPRLEILKKADRTSAKPGDLVAYAVTVTNTGQTTLPKASFVDDLSGVLDDASFVDTNAGAFAKPKLTWTGELAIGATKTVTYRVRVNDPPTGDFKLRNVVTSDTPSNCPGEECGTETPVSGLEIVKKADRTDAKPGDRVTYTVTVRNTGQTPVTGSFTDSLADVLKAATWGGIDAGTFASPVLTWSGELAVGSSATVTYWVTASGPGELRNVVTSDVPGSNCKPGGSDPRCAATVKVRQDPPIAWTGFPALPLAAFGLVLVLAGVLIRRRA
ncbi:DUF11 domain-containing protein [Lentzea sp. NBC_00516]|uniref:DUF7927 domain-containing protein n=1 Tax=Lentzea sp. NBC_00516 TaxID=2903582 RepID=UPI002E81ACF3|nr:GEVED domain-containing protein [Lentzea sp. NBC_00516]WUD21827.1 DUF11 domain-containing protein [Lentzea sp. NBC_00516]